jgi:hypothetical protein
MLKNGTCYQDLGHDHFDRRTKSVQTKRSSPDFRTSAMPSTSRPWRHNRLPFLVSDFGSGRTDGAIGGDGQRSATGSSGVSLYGANFSRARARGAALAARARGWCATAPRFKQLR